MARLIGKRSATTSRSPSLASLKTTLRASRDGAEQPAGQARVVARYERGECGLVDRSLDRRCLPSCPAGPASPYRVHRRPARPKRARETLRYASGGRCCAMAGVPADSPPRADCRPCWPSLSHLGSILVNWSEKYGVRNFAFSASLARKVVLADSNSGPPSSSGKKCPEMIDCMPGRMALRTSCSSVSRRIAVSRPIFPGSAVPIGRADGPQIGHRGIDEAHEVAAAWRGFDALELEQPSVERQALAKRLRERRRPGALQLGETRRLGLGFALLVDTSSATARNATCEGGTSGSRAPAGPAKAASTAARRTTGFPTPTPVSPRERHGSCSTPSF